MLTLYRTSCCSQSSLESCNDGYINACTHVLLSIQTFCKNQYTIKIDRLLDGNHCSYFGGSGQLGNHSNHFDLNI